MKLILLITFIIITICNDIIYGQQYKSGLSSNQKDSIFALIKKHELKEKSSFFLPPYKMVDSQSEVIIIYNVKAHNITDFDYSKKLLPYLQFSSFVNSYLYKNDDNIDSVFAEIDEDGSLAPRIMADGYRLGLNGLEKLLKIIDINQEAVFRMDAFLNFFVLKNNIIYFFVDGKLEQAIPYFKKKYTIEEFREKFLWKTQCKDLMPGIPVTPEEISKKKIIR